MSRSLFDGTERVLWRSRKGWTLLFFAVPWAGAFIGLHGGAGIPAAVWRIACLLLLVAGFAAGGRRVMPVLLWAAVLAAYAGTLAQGKASYAAWEASVGRGQRGILRGSVVSVEPYDRERLALRVRPGKGEPWDIRLIVPAAGRVATLLEGMERPGWPVRLYPFPPSGNPGEFDRRTWAMGRGYLATAYLEDGGSDGPPATDPAGVCRAARSLHERAAEPGLAKALQATAWRWRCRLVEAGADRTGLALGLLLGQTDLLAPGVREAFARAGMAHLLAVSGLHVSSVAAVVAAAGRGSAGRALPVLLGAAAGVVYCGVVGGPSSARRAAAMLVAATVGRAFGRRLDGRRLLFVACGALLASDPFLSFDLGFKLSVAATAAILWVAPIAAHLGESKDGGLGGRLLRRAVQAGTVSLAAQAGTLPLVAGAFSVVSWASPLSNLVAVPVSGAALLLLLAGSVAADVAAWAGAPLLKAGIFLTDALLPLAEAVAPWGGLEMGMGTPFFTPGWYGVLTGALLLWEGRLRPQRPAALRLGKGALAAGLAALALNAAWPTVKGVFGVTEVWVFDVGQGDAILVRAPWGRSLLIDGGGVPGAAATGGYDVGAMRVLPALRRLGVKRLEAVVSTHPHEDHVHGLAAVVAGRRVGRVFASYARTEGAAYRAFLQAVEGKGLTVEHLRRGSVINLEPGVRLEVLSGGDPSDLGGRNPGANNLSIALRLEWRGRRFLLVGDAERPLLDALRAWWDLSADVVLIPHHGGASSFSRPFLDEADPEVAVISVGANAFGHPAPALLEYLAEKGIRTYRTDRDGAVLVQLWPWGIRVRTVR